MSGITVESAAAEAEAKKDQGSGSALSALMSIRNVKDVPRFVWVLAGGFVLLCLLSKKESIPKDILPPAGQ